MRAGCDHHTYVDVLISNSAKLSLLQGEGPIHLVGSHCVDFFGYRDTGAGDETVDECEDEELGEKEAEELVKDAAEATPKKADAVGDSGELKQTLKDSTKRK